MPSEIPADVRTNLVQGADRFNEGSYWDAHEAWEDAWLALRQAGIQGAADLVQGLILATAAFENLDRGKPAGFVTQGAKALHRLRKHAGWGAKLGLADEDGFREALTDVYLDGVRTKATRLEDLPAPPPRLAFRG